MQYLNMSTNYPVFYPLFIFFVTCDFILLRPTTIIIITVQGVKVFYITDMKT